MSIKIKDQFLKSFVTEAELNYITDKAYSAQRTLLDGTGAGNDYIGCLPVLKPSDVADVALKNIPRSFLA